MMQSVRFTGRLLTSNKRAFWSAVPLAPPDGILGLTTAFKKDTFPQKISLGVGAYRDNDGKPYVLEAIRTAEERVVARKLDKEYTEITGVPAFVKTSIEFAYGANCVASKEGRIAATQSISGTGGCRLAGEFVKKFFGENTKIYMPSPTWGNHNAIFKNAGLDPQFYTYYDAASNGVDFEGLVRDVKKAESGSLFMLHACAQNPTGCDPSHAQWDELSRVMKEKNHMVFMDCAYQGFASGNPETDAYSVRKFVADGHKIMLSQSFAKNFGLYGERVGLFSVVTESVEETERVNSQLKLIVRAMYSNPPIHGARIVAEVLSDPELKNRWLVQCKEMADRIIAMRHLLREKLENGPGADPNKSWKHVTEQIGMFCYSGLSKEQVHRLKSEFHIYCTDDGRFSMAGVTTKNIEYLAASVLAVCK